MIFIHIGVLPTENLPAGAVGVVRNPQDYASVREYIYEGLSRNESLEIFVLTRVCDSWFWDLVEYYEDVRLVNDAPTERLKRKLLVNALPTDLTETPELIVKLGLLDLPGPQRSIDDVWGWIIENKLGTLWTKKTPSQEHLSDLINWHLENTVETILQPKVEQIIQRWVNVASGKLRSAYARFWENPRQTAYSLITWRILTPYSRQLREEWLAAEGWYSQKLEDLTDLILSPQQLPPRYIRQKLNPKLQTYWNTQLKDRFNE